MGNEAFKYKKHLFFAVRGGRVLKKVMLFFFLCSLFAAFAVAETTISLQVVDNQITTAEQAQFSLTLQNDLEVRQRYSIYSLTNIHGWNVDTSPLKDKIIELGPGRSYTTTLIAQPLDKELNPGIYTLPVTVSSDHGEDYTQQLKVYLSPDRPQNYLPSLTVDVDMGERVVPGEPLSIKLFVENRNPRNLTDLGIQLESDAQDFVQGTIVSVPPLERKTFEFSVTPSAQLQPGDYFLYFIFTYDSETVKIVEERFEVVPVISPFSVQTSSESTFMKRFTTVQLTNDGNTRNTQVAGVPVSFWEGLFTQGEEQLTRVDGVRMVAWEVELAPGESVTYQTTTNYRWLLYIGALILLFVIFYFLVQAPVVATKSAQTTRSDNESLSEIKITLEVRNRSKKPLHNLQVTDYVPSIANIDKSLELGTLKPTNVSHGKKRSKVTWKLAELDVGEHRIITYKVRAKLNIVGSFALPRAEIQYHKKGNKRGKAYSNTFQLTA